MAHQIYAEPSPSVETANLIVANQFFKKSAYITEGKCQNRTPAPVIGGIGYEEKKKSKSMQEKNFRYGRKAFQEVI